MEFIHCNYCGNYPFSGKNRFCLTSCGHIICETCSRCFVDTCLTCKSKCRLAEINAQAKPEVKTLFMDGSEILKENVKKTVQVIQFQKQHIKSLGSHYKNKMEALEAAHVECERLKNDVLFLRKENEELKEKIELYEQREQNWIGSGTNTVGRTLLDSDDIMRPQHPQGRQRRDFGAVGSGRPIFNFPSSEQVEIVENTNRIYSSMSTPSTVKTPSIIKTPEHLAGRSAITIGREYNFQPQQTNYRFTSRNHSNNSPTPGHFISTPASFNSSSGGSGFLRTPEMTIADRLRRLNCQL